MSDSTFILGPQGPFASVIARFSARTQQQQMCSQIESLINQRQGVLVCESPTGTGKTLAYLVALVNSGNSAIISTATRHLQDQVFYKDLPLVLKTLDLEKRICLLKGRSNYLCLHRLHTVAAVEAAKSGNLDQRYQSVCQWSDQTGTGDINDMPDLEENSILRPLITSTSDNCLGSQCSHFNECFVRKARVKALEADIVVVNHHLYLAHMVLNEDGLGQLLPRSEVLIFDEAHSLPETASMQLSRSLSSRQLMQLVSEIKTLIIAEQKAIDELFEIVDLVEKKLSQAMRMFSVAQKLEAEELFRDKQILEVFEELLAALDRLSQYLSADSDTKEFELLYQRASYFGELLGECLFNEHEKEKYFCWVDAAHLQFRINQTPIELTEFGQRLTQDDSVCCVLVSATLSSGGDFSYFTDQLGLVESQTCSWNSPYDYARQCRLYLPRGLPDPRHPGFTQALHDCAIELINLYGGKTFFLFTSHQAMETAYEQLADRLDYPLLKQGQKPKHELIDQFKLLDNAVLLGTSSFWEGVDVKGSSLSCVIIDKLPFASPQDPVLRARLKRMEQRGRNPFVHYQIPQMIISLKQGIGRLIRDEDDRGVVMIGDCRLTTKSYGKRVLRALPEIPLTSDFNEIKKFVRQEAV